MSWQSSVTVKMYTYPHGFWIAVHEVMLRSVRSSQPVAGSQSPPCCSRRFTRNSRKTQSLAVPANHVIST